MKSFLLSFVMLALTAAQSFGQCGTQGGCNSGAQRGGQGGGRGFAPPLVPPSISPEPAQPQASNPAPLAPVPPVTPAAPSQPPRIAQAKSCECDNTKLASAIQELAVTLNQIKSTISSDGDRLTALEKSAPAGPPQIDTKALAQAVADELGLNKPQVDPTKPTHYVLVATIADGKSYGELQDYVTAAKSKFPKIAIVDSKNVPFPVVGGYPQLLGYDSKGNVLQTVKGIGPVERQLGWLAAK